MRKRESPESSLRRFFGNRSEGIIAAYLFGSHARAQAHPESDVDVAVLVDSGPFPDAASRFDLRLRLIGELMRTLGMNDIDVVMLNDAPPELGRKVVQEGIRVYAPDGEAARAYERDVQLRAADLDPFLRRARRRLLEHYILR